MPFSEVDDLLRTLRSRAIPQGQFIFSTGQEATCLYILHDGLIKVSYITPDGDTKILEICETGDIFGELFLGEYRFRIGQAEAMTDCVVYVLNEDDLQRIIKTYPTIAMNFIRHLG